MYKSAIYPIFENYSMQKLGPSSESLTVIISSGNFVWAEDWLSLIMAEDCN